MASSSQRGMASQADQRSQHENARKTREEYVKLQHDITRSKDDLEDPSKSTLQDYLKRVNETQREVAHPREQAKDAEAFSLLTEFGCKRAQKMVAGNKVKSGQDLLRALRHKFGSADNDDLENDPDAFSWDRLSQAVKGFFFTAPGMTCMLGAIDAAPKPRKPVAQKVQKKKVGVLERPVELHNTEDQEKQETDRNMEEMWEVLNRVQHAGLLELTLNTRSFAQTVENMFTLSFLVRDSKVKFLKDEELGTVVHVHKPQKAPQQQQHQDPALTKERLQYIQSYSMVDWEEWCQHVAPAQCLMKDRPDYGGHAGADLLRQPQQHAAGSHHQPASVTGGTAIKRRAADEVRPASDCKHDAAAVSLPMSVTACRLAADFQA